MKFLIYAILGATLCAPVRLAYAQSDGLGTLAAQLEEDEKWRSKP